MFNILRKDCYTCTHDREESDMCYGCRVLFTSDTVMKSQSYKRATGVYPNRAMLENDILTVQQELEELTRIKGELT